MILWPEKRWNAHHFPSGNPDCSSPPLPNLVTASWAERPGEWVTPRPLIWGGLPGQQMKGSQRAACSHPIALVVKKKSGVQGSSQYFSMNQTWAKVGSRGSLETVHCRLIRGAGRGAPRSETTRRSGVLEGGGLRAVWVPSRGLSHAECQGIEPPSPAHCPLSVPLTPAPCHSLAEDADFGNRGPSCPPHAPRECLCSVRVSTVGVYFTPRGKLSFWDSVSFSVSLSKMKDFL